MKRISVFSVLVIILISGCTQERKVEYTLGCVVSSVLYTKTGNIVNFKREDAIKNGYVYKFLIYNDGIVVVNGVDTYVKDKNIERSYSLQRENRVDTNMKFQFTQEFDDVKFLLVKRDEEFHYDCIKEQE